MIELVIDSFAGGGGASLGIAWATGRAPDIAINHDEHALAMHAANHPSTQHVREDVWKAELKRLVGRCKVGLLWLSPDCKHFSRAKGAKPVAKEIRSLAWIACKWAEQIKPRVIFLENVREFADWGPLVPRLECRECDWRGTEGQAVLVRTRRRCPRCESLKLRDSGEKVPCPDRKGLTFRRFIGRLRNLGYKVEYKNLDAADYGAPTHRKRLFLVARRDGKPIVWPEPTHAAPDKLDDMPLFDRLKPYRTAAECIDWSIPCPSIFTRKKPLAEKTLRRIALGIKRYVIDNPKPFIVPVTHNGERRNHSIDEPLPTVTSANRGELGLVVPTVVSLAHGGDGTWGNSRSQDGSKPLGTIHAGGGNHALASAYLVRHHGDGGSVGREVDRPAPTAVDRETTNQLCMAYIAKHFGGMVGVEPETPLPTTTTKGCQNQVVAATLVQSGYGERQGQRPRTLDLERPLGTVVAGGSKHATVAAFLMRYFGTGVGQEAGDPLFTTTTKDRTALVTVTVNGEPYVIVDIGMRMLTPRELARAQGFPDTYVLTGTKTSQVARIGNSVCPHVAKALVEANYSKVRVPA